MADATTKPPAMNLYQKLAAITGKIGAIKKDGRSGGYGDNYTFIEYGAIAARIRELFAEYGVVIIPYMKAGSRSNIKSSKGKDGVHAVVPFVFVVRNADKPEEKFSVTWFGEAIDYGDKAINKAATAALKYYLMRQFNISEKGDDPDAETHEYGATAKKPDVAPPKQTASKPSAADVQKLRLQKMAQLDALLAQLLVQDGEDRADFFQDSIGKNQPETLGDIARAIKFAQTRIDDHAEAAA